MNTPATRQKDSIDGFLGLTLFFLFWPLVNAVGLAIVEASGYTLKTGGGLLNLLLYALSLLCGIFFFIVLVYWLRKKHAPVQGFKTVMSALAAMLLATALNLGVILLSFYCKVGECPHWN